MDKKHDGKDYVVFSQRLAGWLMLYGCKLLKVDQSRHDSNKLIYFFPNTEYVLKQVEEYKIKNPKL